MLASSNHQKIERCFTRVGPGLAQKGTSHVRCCLLLILNRVKWPPRLLAQI